MAKQLLVLSIKQIFNHRLGARFHHVLWILVLIRLLMPVAFESTFSIFNFFEGRAQKFSNSQAIDYTRNGQENESGLFQNSRPSTERNIGEAVKTEVKTYSFLLKVFSRIWLTGVLFLVLFSCAVTIKFKRRTKVFKRVTDPEIQSLVEQCSQKVKIKKSIPVYMDSYFKSPCISGAIHPGIYLPEDIRGRVGQHELKHILLHELAHYKRKDLFYSFLATLAALIHWFNPLVWLAAKKMRVDREIACDACVMEMLGEEERVSYGTTIIHLAN
ncbi:MAG: hypothetical protein GX425_16885 [Peptococcaceae bacterium]|nr:hypothetical protein [Peptococcaceae bacterium]